MNAITIKKAQRSRITIAGHEVEVFKLPSGEYVMSQTQAAGVVGMEHWSIVKWLQTNHAKALLGEDLAIVTMPAEGFNKPINAVSLDVVSAYWHRQSTLGNDKAGALTYACMKETLERRCDAVFGVSRTEQERESRAVKSRNLWSESREFAKRCQMAFNNACWLNGYRASVVHDELTKRVTGMTAQQHRGLLLVGDNPEIGLDHVANAKHLEILAQAKLNFASYRKGTMLERCDRAVRDAVDVFSLRSAG